LKILKQFQKDKIAKEKKRNYIEMLIQDINNNTDNNHDTINKRANNNLSTPKIAYNYIINQKYEINNLKFNTFFNKPEIDIINKNLISTSINDYINNFKNYKLNLNRNNFIQITINPDWNCY